MATMGKEAAANGGFRLNYKRTFTIGFAFFGILLLWQVYDLWCPTFLTELFKKAFSTADEKQVQYLVGIMMAIDNLAALILLPIFGRLSDKTHTKIGKRMPYILVGTFVCAVAFPFIPLLFHFNSLAGTIIMMATVVVFAMMYRNPAVALMPDMTPKPLRSKANGIINIMGYIGGFFATVVGMVFVLSQYLGKGTGATESWAYNNIWAVELPFIIASVLMVVSAMFLFFNIKENKIAEEVKDEMARGEEVSEAADKISVDDESPMTKANRIMLYLILGAEFFWFMADNGVSTFLNNYIIYGLNGNSASTSLLTIIGGVGSVLGFVFGGTIAEKITRKYTVISGLSLALVSYIVWIIMTFAVGFGGTTLPMWLIILWFVKGFGMSLVHVNSYPMVVELCSSKKIGAFTGYYYASSMAAQTITPILLGTLLLVPDFDWFLLPIYAGICIAVSVTVFFFIKNAKGKTEFKKGLEALDND
ncbi:MAG: MFS transporter [Clostridia bacterium]|nr:MFS transporter [Clostridia bacterium]